MQANDLLVDYGLALLVDVLKEHGRSMTKHFKRLEVADVYYLSFVSKGGAKGHSIQVKASNEKDLIRGNWSSCQVNCWNPFDTHIDSITFDMTDGKPTACFLSRKNMTQTKTRVYLFLSEVMNVKGLDLSMFEEAYGKYINSYFGTIQKGLETFGLVDEAYKSPRIEKTNEANNAMSEQDVPEILALELVTGKYIGKGVAKANRIVFNNVAKWAANEKLDVAHIGGDKIEFLAILGTREELRNLKNRVEAPKNKKKSETAYVKSALTRMEKMLK